MSPKKYNIYEYRDNEYIGEYESKYFVPVEFIKEYDLASVYHLSDDTICTFNGENVFPISRGLALELNSSFNLNTDICVILDIPEQEETTNGKKM